MHEGRRLDRRHARFVPDLHHIVLAPDQRRRLAGALCCALGGDVSDRARPDRRGAGERGGAGTEVELVNDDPAAFVLDVTPAG